MIAVPNKEEILAMKWWRKFRFLHFLEVAGDLLCKCLWRGNWEDSWKLIRIAWVLTRKDELDEIKRLAGAK